MSGPLPELLAPLTVPASWVYERIIEARNRRYGRGVGVEKLPVPVISVGNITTGGTGKTPMVMWVAKFLRERGHHPAIALRGYGATGDQPSDEAIEYAERIPDVPLLVHPDRLAASHQHLQSSPDTDCIILDDGFQHRRLHRDLDIVLIDAAANTFAERMIPAGHLREPLHNLARANAMIVTRTPGDSIEMDSQISNRKSQVSNLDNEVSNLKTQIERYHKSPPLAFTRHAWTHLRIITANGEELASADWLRGKRLVTLLGVGNPRSIIAQLEAAVATVAADVPAGDHERFSRAKLEVARGLCDGVSGEGGLVMTQKDWVRARDLIDLQRWPVPIIIPQLEIEFLEGREPLEQLLLAACGLARARPQS